jgi:metal-responsive CopG/Arc/MetJ family transcriptional regulator
MVVGLLMVTGTLGHSAVLRVVVERKSEIEQEVVLNLHQHTEGDHALEMELMLGDLDSGRKEATEK